ncbi:MAG: malonyl-ACP O-methyltransferase BioC [Gammaproteobacteria bacterium]|nr:malonyl-ACP O-methyltransferase BioC [Gammaproteobacteria bacterium]
MSAGSVTIDKEQARRAFERAATRYDEVAVLQREIGRRMLERLDYVRLAPGTVLDAGCGTAVATAELAQRYPDADVVALDFAHGMLRHARGRGGLARAPHWVCGDIEALPLAGGSVDLVYSNAALQWSTDLAATFADLARVLRPGGLLMFSTFGPDTLAELRAAWAQVDGDSHVSGFPDMHDVGDLLVRARFADPVMDCERLTVTYATVDDLMRDLKLLGAHNVTARRARGLTGRGRLAAMRAAYERFRRDGRLPATYEVVYGHAWAPLQRQEGPGVTAVPVSAIGRR